MSPSTPSARKIALPKTSFLNLPAELRNEVYRLSLIGDTPIPIRFKAPCVPQPSLSMANKQIRTECLSIFYGENVFWTTQAFTVDAWFMHMDGKQLAQVREVRLQPCAQLEPSALIKAIMGRHTGRGLKEDVMKMEVGAEWFSVRDAREKAPSLLEQAGIAEISDMLMEII
ncbi:Hypothetical predicted protein [Lecanosticta acicola]|uniref:Uncharacterized protein n=1 Tax=Lecanosticta acicola TaxID=111012 RepID=A0AAI9EBV7_9PEZI|nr:Hypothetical predicted protein [Lecanosticta acicola]